MVLCAISGDSEKLNERSCGNSPTFGWSIAHLMGNTFLCGCCSGWNGAYTVGYGGLYIIHVNDSIFSIEIKERFYQTQSKR